MRKTYEVHFVDVEGFMRVGNITTSKLAAIESAKCLRKFGPDGITNVRVLVQIDPPAEKGGES